MHLYISTSNDPYFNIATEEHFLKNRYEDFFFLYINRPSLIVGKHQNTMAEINVPYVMENNIPVVRRLSGGGAVFHDFGNLNFCFIQNGKPGYLVDFKKFSQPILDLLQQLEINAWLRGKSDLVIDNLKFSGNAEHVYKNRVLHHGTLLYSSELNQLNEAIKADWGKFTDKAVRSNRSQVTNISEHLKNPLSIDAFGHMLVQSIKKQDPHTKEITLELSEIELINPLVKDKYATWEWNFSYSPAYEFSRNIELPQGSLFVKFQVEKGIIQTINCEYNGKSQPKVEELLKGVRHEYHILKEKLHLLFAQQPPMGFTFENLLTVLF